MFKTFFVFIVSILLNLFGFCHDSNKAFFKINQDEQFLKIEAEFPWTIRNALIQFNPELESATTKEEFITSFKKYLELNLILSSNSGNPFKLIQLKEINNSGHTHQSNYSIIYKGEHLKRIKNTLLFNVKKDQTNYHQIRYNDGDLKFTTTINQSTYQLPNTTFSIYWLTLLLPISILLLFLKKKKVVSL